MEIKWIQYASIRIGEFVAEFLNRLTVPDMRYSTLKLINVLLLEHVFIVVGCNITKQARNRLENKLDMTKRSQVILMNRNHILSLFIDINLRPCQKVKCLRQ